MHYLMHKKLCCSDKVIDLWIALNFKHMLKILSIILKLLENPKEISHSCWKSMGSKE